MSADSIWSELKRVVVAVVCQSDKFKWFDQYSLSAPQIGGTMLPKLFPTWLTKPVHTGQTCPLSDCGRRCCAPLVFKVAAPVLIHYRLDTGINLNKHITSRNQLTHKNATFQIDWLLFLSLTHPNLTQTNLLIISNYHHQHYYCWFVFDWTSKLSFINYTHIWIFKKIAAKWIKP